MSKTKNSGLEDQYGAEPFEQQRFGTAGAEGVKDQTLEWSGTYPAHPGRYIQAQQTVHY